jgi:hypothetical protein
MKHIGNVFDYIYKGCPIDDFRGFEHELSSEYRRNEIEIEFCKFVLGLDDSEIRNVAVLFNSGLTYILIKEDNNGTTYLFGSENISYIEKEPVLVEWKKHIFEFDCDNFKRLTIQELVNDFLTKNPSVDCKFEKIINFFDNVGIARNSNI